MHGFVPAFGNPDGFYHTKIAEMLLSDGILHQFPYASVTTLVDVFADHHLMYHIILVPFILLFPLLWGVKIATIIFAASVFAVLYLFMKK